MFYADQNRAVATGNVVFRQGNNQISADRADFDTKTRLGTFYNASGFATVQPPRQAARPAALRRLRSSDKRRSSISSGRRSRRSGRGNTRSSRAASRPASSRRPDGICTPTRSCSTWITTRCCDTVVNVKGVPLLYLPILYYPTKKEDRATGFSFPPTGRRRFEDSRFITPFSGRSTAARTRRSCTTGSRSPVRASAVSTGIISAAAGRQSPRVSARPARDDRASRPPSKLSAQWVGESAVARQAARKGSSRLLLEHRDEPDIQHQHQRDITEPA